MKEFFDKEYSAKEAYGRLYVYAKRYRMRLIIGLLAGSITAGTWIPVFQVIQPMLKQVQGAGIEKEMMATTAPEIKTSQELASAPQSQSTVKRGPKIHGVTVNDKLPSWFNKAEALAKKMGLNLRDDEGHMTGTLLLFGGFVIPLVVFLRLFLIYINQYFLAWAGTNVVTDLRKEMLEHIERQGLQFFGRIDVGQLISRSTTDPLQVQMIIHNTLADIFRAPFEVAVSIGFVIYFAWQNQMMETLLLIAIGFPIFFLPIVVIGRMIRRWSKKSMERGSVIVSKIHEILTGIRVVKAYDMEKEEAKRYADINDYCVKSVLKTQRFGLLVTPTVETVGIILIFVFIIYCFMRALTLDAIVPLLVPFLIIYKPLKQITRIQVQVEQGRAALARIFSLLDVHMELPEAVPSVAKPTFNTAIRFEDVSFTYDTAEEASVKNAVFDIPYGSVVAVVGGTGSGKSTMSNLLARFYDPTSGRITMDGVDLRDIAISDLRTLIGVVSQETILFNDTIANNIAYGTAGATREQIIAAAKMANAHAFIMAQPEGYERMAGEKGFALSGGERQRIAIARAILKNPPILILDEATSALDTVTERLVQDAINTLMANRTTFAIAHRLSTIRHANLILVMDHGTIVERGTHDTLYAAGGAYRKLCDMQMSD